MSMPLTHTIEDRWPLRVPVLIAGGGPVGLALAALLGRYGVACLVVEADASYCEGSRAICISRRSQEIMGWVGADRALVEKGLSWTGGRSFFRDREVLHFRMPSEPGERFAPMVNIQQFYVEEFAARAARETGDQVDIRWSSRVVDVQQHADHAEVTIATPDGEQHVVRADWLVACDGGRSTVRERSGLAFEGMQYEGRYVIVDIEQATARPVERLAWFDPPSNPGSTILMHRQPDNVWRIDYQIADDEDAAEAVKPENVLPRVQSHLQMIGETAPWKPLWISIYNAKCLTLDRYRHGRVLFAGDAAHLVPIFGVRGLNSGLDDAGNLAWKLALVVGGQADAALLDSYSSERVHATRQNIRYGAKSTEFMAPPHAGFTLMREAALRLAGENETVRSLINPRQSTPISYAGSPLNLPSRTPQPSPGPGETAPDALVGTRHLTQLFGHGFVALLFSDTPVPDFIGGLETGQGLAGLTVWRLSRTPVGDPTAELHDATGDARRRYGAAEGNLVLVRPDGYVMARWPLADAAAVNAALAPYRSPPTSDGESA
ncbi:FAD-dependent oxidoreductase [Rhizobacter fulvus]